MESRVRNRRHTVSDTGDFDLIRWRTPGGGRLSETSLLRLALLTFLKRKLGEGGAAGHVSGSCWSPAPRQRRQLDWLIDVGERVSE